MNEIKTPFSITCLLLFILLFSCNEVKKEGKPSYVFELDSNYLPQDDFFHFVNMKFIKEHRLKNKRNYFNELLATKLAYYSRLEAMYNELLLMEDEKLSPLQLNVKRLYESALDSTLIEEDGDQAIRPFVEKIPSVQDLQALADYYSFGSRFGCYMPLYFDLELLHGANPKGINYPRLHAFYSPLFPWDEFHQDSPEFGYFETFVFQTLKALQYDSLNIVQKLKNIVAIDKSLYKSLEEYDKNKNNHFVPLSLLQREVTGFDWLRLGENYGIQPTDTILVYDWEVLQQFVKLQRQFNDEQWFDYFEFNVYDSYAYLLPQKFREPSYVYNYQLGKTEIPVDASWDNFVQLILNFYMTDVTNHLYYERYCTPDTKEHITSLYEEMKEGFMKDLSSNPWVDNVTKAGGMQRLQEAHLQLFYSMDDNRYKNLNLKKQSLIRNFLEMCENHNEYVVRVSMNKPVDYDQFYYRLDHFFPFSMSERKIIFIPVSFAIAPYFQVNGEPYQNYAGIMVNIGHELSHMLDATPGGYYSSLDKDEIWWGDEAFDVMGQIQAKIILQHLYFNYSQTLRAMNRVEMYERFCDVSGFELAYRAFARKVNLEEKPPGSPFTNAQLFFIHYAMVNRGYFDEKELSSHSDVVYFYLNDVKVNSILANSLEFYQAFNVKEGDGMYLPDSLRFKFWE